MVKKRAGLAALIAALSLMVFPASAQNRFDFTIEQTRAVMPDITVYCTQEDDLDWESTEITATLDGVQLEPVSSLPHTEGTLYIFLVDCSTSMTRYQTDAVKESLEAFISDKQPEDMVMLISFGEGVEMLLEGDESPEEIRQAIGSLNNRQHGTVLFDAINKAVSVSESESEKLPARKIAVVFTDAEDFAVGSVTHNELLSRLSQASLPVYAVGMETGTKGSLDAMGVLARSSGGAISVVSIPEISRAVEGIAQMVQNGRVLRFRAPTNEIDGSTRQLVIQVEWEDGSVAKEVSLLPKQWTPDTAAPEVLEIAQMTANSIKITFSEPVYGADLPEHFRISTGGREYTIQQATYLPLDNAVVLTTAETLENGDCNIACLNITDRSMEQNKLAEQHEAALEGAPGEKPFAWWIALAGAALAGIIVAAVLVSRRGKKEIVLQSLPIPEPVPVPVAAAARGPEARHHFARQTVKPLRMIVTDQNGLCHQIDVKVDGSLFVGRSQICNLYFDDDRLSPQHFAIEAQDQGFYLQDLGSQNGTFLNGVRVKNKRRLEDRDTITAGQETFVYVQPGNQR